MLKKTLILALFFSSCTLFPPKPPDELEKLSEDCLKAKKGIDIQIQPIEPPSKK